MAEQDKVLVGETDYESAQPTIDGLKLHGFAVVSALDASQVVRIAKLAKPDVALIDANLDGGGVEAVRLIRRNVFTTHMPVVMVAGDADPRGDDFLAAGAQECIARPASLEAICASLDRHKLQSLDFTLAPAEAIAAPARLAALEATGLLDSAPEERYDRLTRLASRLLGSRASLVSLVDKDRQFFKSQAGLPEPWASQRQTRLSHSFCQWVVSGKEPVVVSDSKEHPTLRSNLAVRDLGVIAYAGVPIKGQAGEVIGSFCAIDSTPRSWTDDEVATLDDLARVTEAFAQFQSDKNGGAAGVATRLDASEAARVAEGAVAGVERLLERQGARLTPEECRDLDAIREENVAWLKRATSPRRPAGSSPAG